MVEGWKCGSNSYWIAFCATLSEKGSSFVSKNFIPTNKIYLRLRKKRGPQKEAQQSVKWMNSEECSRANSQASKPKLQHKPQTVQGWDIVPHPISSLQFQNPWDV